MDTRTVKKRQAGRRPRSEASVGDTRAQILTAARSVFAKRGLDGASVREVAAAARVNNAMIYYHFKDKIQLYRAVLVDSFLAFNKVWENEVFNTASPVRTKIRTYVEELIRFQHSNEELRRILSIEFASCGQIKWLSEKLFRDGHKKLNRLIQTGIKNGELKRVEPAIAGMMLVSMVVNAFIMQPAVEYSSGRTVDLSVRKFSAFVTDVFFEGLGKQNTNLKNRRSSREFA